MARSLSWQRGFLAGTNLFQADALSVKMTAVGRRVIEFGEPRTTWFGTPRPKNLSGEGIISRVLASYT